MLQTLVEAVLLCYPWHAGAPFSINKFASSTGNTRASGVGVYCHLWPPVYNTLSSRFNSASKTEKKIFRNLISWYVMTGFKHSLFNSLPPAIKRSAVSCQVFILPYFGWDILPGIRHSFAKPDVFVCPLLLALPTPRKLPWQLRRQARVP